MITVLLVSAVGAGAASPNKNFWAKLIRFEQIWLDLGKILAKLKRNLGKRDQI